MEMSSQTVLKLPKAINVPRDTVLPMPHTNFVCLTIGSRGDVQPYIALCLGLKKAGHQVTIVTHEEYKAWIEGFGIKHRTAGGDPGMLMKLSVENKMFSPQFFKESISNVSFHLSVPGYVRSFRLVFLCSTRSGSMNVSIPVYPYCTY